jgi:hypothetical protein
MVSSIAIPWIVRDLQHDPGPVPGLFQKREHAYRLGIAVKFRLQPSAYQKAGEHLPSRRDGCGVSNRQTSNHIWTKSSPRRQQTRAWMADGHGLPSVVRRDMRKGLHLELYQIDWAEH